jgi:hypothetical protein
VMVADAAWTATIFTSPVGAIQYLRSC